MAPATRIKSMRSGGSAKATVYARAAARSIALSLPKSFQEAAMTDQKFEFFRVVRIGRRLSQSPYHRQRARPRPADETGRPRLVHVLPSDSYRVSGAAVRHKLTRRSRNTCVLLSLLEAKTDA